MLGDVSSRVKETLQLEGFLRLKYQEFYESKTWYDQIWYDNGQMLYR